MAAGIEAQVAKVASATLSPKWMERPFIYEYLRPVGAQGQNNTKLMYGVPGVGVSGPVHVKDQVSQPELDEADTEPQSISLWRPLPSEAEQVLFKGEETVQLTIDQAGKVRSAKMLTPASDPELLQAAKDWKFIPALRDRKPVAYKLKMDVQALR